MAKTETAGQTTNSVPTLEQLAAAGGAITITRLTWDAVNVGDYVVFHLTEIEERGGEGGGRQKRDTYPVFIGKTRNGTTFETFVPVNLRKLLNNKMLGKVFALKLDSREPGRTDPTKLYGEYSLHWFKNGFPDGTPEPDWTAIAEYREARKEQRNGVGSGAPLPGASDELPW